LIPHTPEILRTEVQFPPFGPKHSKCFLKTYKLKNVILTETNLHQGKLLDILYLKENIPMDFDPKISKFLINMQTKIMIQDKKLY
jgi:hypothetical protein